MRNRDSSGLQQLSTFTLRLLRNATQGTWRTALGLGTAATLDSDTDTALAANSDLRLATQKAIKSYVDNLVTGLLELKGSTDCSANPNYPAASKGDSYYVTVAGKIGGASGKSVDVGDVYVALADNAGGTEASVGSSWFVLEHNLSGIPTLSGDNTWTGKQTFQKATVSVPVALVDAATIATDASLGNRFRVTLGGNRTLGAPTNPTDGQQCTWELKQDGTGSRTITLATGAGGFALGTDITTTVLSTTAGLTDFLTAIYNLSADRWRVVGFVKGY